MKKITNRKAGEYVANKMDFKGSNLMGEWITELTYVVYSYGVPIFIYCKSAGEWYENAEWYSVTTSRHKNQARPQESMIKITGGVMTSSLFPDVMANYFLMTNAV